MNTLQKRLTQVKKKQLELMVDQMQMRCPLTFQEE